MAPKAKKHVAKAVKKGGKKKKNQCLTFYIHCKSVAEDMVLDVSDFTTFLAERIKVNGKVGQLAANGVAVTNHGTSITLTSRIAFSKRYLKYLTKKYLKRLVLRDFVRVVAPTKDAYELRYFQVTPNEGEESDNEI
ncbi:hypothetical protein AB6A40_002974 [Gnathostoma spinigerum]|uniref:Large ribosomal subunit protein eL22 n=1 Tax=Gnathostoma spinigerum TaxID=75299 RepID=A0ABD6E853_9BILA